ncbi:hypothetical protein Pmani_039986 [Petrolisthes manimaculis]|uniref:Uncharacterized protein n=1 Tax=Petrolisthes manimaculis TaxID=1843537 RepID=A0AAE1ND62_9EUCA|nr:hypothetical protein Pmani_039986 [Petrolisthes manimaculis]
MTNEANQPKSKSWVWNEHRGELVKIRQDGRPASPSASSSTSRRLSLQTGQKHINRELLTSKRLVEGEWGSLDPGEWESDPQAPVTFNQCVKVALHLQAAQTSLSPLFLKVLRLQKVRELLRGLVEYFAELFVQADFIRGIEPPTVGNREVLQERWARCLGSVLDPLAATYGQLILGHGLGNLHHIKRGRSLHSHTTRDNHIYESLYQLLELLVWVIFRRRDRSVIHSEITRLFRGKPGLEHEQQQQRQQQQQLQQQHTPQQTGGGSDGDAADDDDGNDDGDGVVREKSGLMLRQIPDLSLTSSISSLGGDALPPLVYVSQEEGVRGGGVWVLGARRAELNEYLEPAAPEEDQISLLD